MNPRNQVTNEVPADEAPAGVASPAVAGSTLAEPDLASDLERASRLLSLARDLLIGQSAPFPVLEAGRRLKIREASRAFRIAHHARQLAGGDRDDRQLARAIEILDAVRSTLVVAALRTLRDLPPGARALSAMLVTPEPKRRQPRASTQSSANHSPSDKKEDRA